MIGFLFDVLGLIADIPFWIIVAATAYGLVTRHKDRETRLAAVLRTYSKLCQTTMEMLWAAQRMMPAKPKRAAKSGFLGAATALPLLARLPWLKIGAGLTVAGVLAWGVLSYGAMREAKGEVRIQAQWEAAVKKTMAAAAKSQEALNDHSAKVDDGLRGRTAEIDADVSRETIRIDRATDESLMADWTAGVERVRNEARGVHFSVNPSASPFQPPRPLLAT